MDCLIDYIGVRGYCTTEPESGMYINELPGISLESIEKLADKEQVTFKAVWNDVQQRSIRRFVRDFTNKFKNKYVGYCCKEGCEIEDLICTMKADLIDALMFFLAADLMIERLYSSRLNRYTTIDREQASELKDYFQVEYEKAINSAIKHIPHELIEECYECVSQIQRVERLP